MHTTRASTDSFLLPRSNSLSRPSSRTSLRASSPSYSPIPDDPVALRNQMSTIKHSIRQQQAHLNKLETELLRGPRPLPRDPAGSPELSPRGRMDTPISPTPPPSYTSHNSMGTSRMQRRASRDVLEELAGPASNLPLPTSAARHSASASSLLSQESMNGIPEGIPLEFGAGPSTPVRSRRLSSPTRTLSRIPVASVGNARTLADEGQSLHSTDLTSLNGSTSSLAPPHSPNSTSSRRISLTPGGTSKVLADLQTGVANARNALENTKQQLRLSQRAVATLTRQTEDLKEGRERLRLENEGLNNVVARKERLLQEAVARARKAEEERDILRAQLKSETTTSKKSLRDMEGALSETTALSQRREREYVTLRDSVKGLVDGFRADHSTLRDELRKREERWRKEAEDVGRKYRLLVEEAKAAERARIDAKTAQADDVRVGAELEAQFRNDIAALKEEVERSGRESDEAVQLARDLATELARLRRLMQTAGRRQSTVPT